MPGFGDVIILAVIGVAVFFAIRSLRKDHKKGGCTGCSGCSGGCGSCKYKQ